MVLFLGLHALGLNWNGWPNCSGITWWFGPEYSLCGGNLKDTAAILKIDPATIYRKRSRCGLEEPPKFHKLSARLIFPNIDPRLPPQAPRWVGHLATCLPNLAVGLPCHLSKSQGMEAYFFVSTVAVAIHILALYWHRITAQTNQGFSP